MKEALAKHGMTPVARLQNLGVTGPRAIFAHGVHLSDEDIAILARTGTSVIYNPESNMKLGSGVAPIPKLLKAGVKVGIGTDGAASNNDLSILGEMDTAAKLQKLEHQDGTAMTAVQALRMATYDGARALGLGQDVGSLEAGKKADVITIHLRRPHLQPVHDLASLLVYSAKGSDVDTTICDGRLLLDAGRLLTLDENRIYGEVEELADSIRAELRI